MTTISSTDQKNRSSRMLWCSSFIVLLAVSVPSSASAAIHPIVRYALASGAIVVALFLLSENDEYDEVKKESPGMGEKKNKECEDVTQDASIESNLAEDESDASRSAEADEQPTDTAEAVGSTKRGGDDEDSNDNDDTDNNFGNNTWRCACENGFLPPGLLKSFGGAEAMMRLGTGQCYHKG